ncbi:TrkA C-terminal domain-containing protein [Hutsoniella sourekii]|uniref:TrkA C-terminal domain-containing protein n=1 Tax=Hutsoniella sourekii TaxID=87650 RepID=UPI000483AD5F|nr:TrkA C-terminal domain-containing protein [Hutsoniella sourekii]
MRQIKQAKYIQIASQLAEMIANGEIKEGEKISARGFISQTYQVSFETGRKALIVLKDLGIVSTFKGSGSFVASQAKAKQYVKQYKDIQSLEESRLEILDNYQQQKAIWQQFEKQLNQYMDQMHKTIDYYPFVPNELLLTEKAHWLNLSVADINLWHQTEATLVAVRRQGELVISPGPYFILQEQDRLYYVGPLSSIERMYHLFYGEDDSKLQLNK